jgi:hypothetical protein
MMKLSCKTGITQIGCVLRRALNENEKLSAVVYVGDYCEEEAGELLPLAQRLGARQVPLFIFQENGGNGTDNDFAYARSIFRGLAEASGGVHLEFRPDSGNVLKRIALGHCGLLGKRYRRSRAAGAAYNIRSERTAWPIVARVRKREVNEDARHRSGLGATRR